MATGEHKRKPFYVTCSSCGKEFMAYSRKAQYCPECKKIIHRQEQARYKAKMRMSAADVPDVPADDYDTLAEKIKKTAPIETCLVQHKEDNMDTERAERLKTFPSLSNMTEHPEYFTGDTPESLGQTTTVPAYNGTTVDMPDVTADQVVKMTEALREGLRKNKRDVLLSLYSTICEICKDVEITVPEVLDRLTRIDEALS